MQDVAARYKRPSSQKSARNVRCWAIVPSLLLIAGLSGCGMMDVYKPHEKRCKQFCNNDNADAQKDVPFNFDLGYWNQVTPRSQLDVNTELAPLLRSNPFKLLSNAMKTASEDVSEAKQTIEKPPLSAQGECLKQVFTAPFTKSDGRSEIGLDYGKCVDLAKLEERLNSNRNTAKDGKIKVIELDSALHLISMGQLRTTNGGDALHDADTGLNLLSSLPFRSVRAADVANPDDNHTLKFRMVRGSVQGTAVEKIGSTTILKKSWGVLYAGLDEAHPLQVEWTPSQNSVRFLGSLATLSAASQRGATQTQWDGFGYTREFIFTNLTLSGTNIEMNSQLGWSEQTNMTGSYFLRINGDLIEAGGQNSKLFHMKALGRACVLDVGLVTGFQGETPVEQPIGQISICNAAN